MELRFKRSEIGVPTPDFVPSEPILPSETGNFTQPILCEGEIRQIAVHLIRPNPAQPRTEFDEEALVQLADSIRAYGILQPLTVRPLPNPDSDGKCYELVAGERRLRAAKLIGCASVPCVLVAIDGKKSAELAIIENIQRKDLNLFEEASAIASLIDLYALTQDQVAKRLSTSQSYVANKLRILRLTPFEREKILRHHLTERHARALLRIESPTERAQVLSDIISRSLNVAQTEEYIEKRINEAKMPKKDAKKSLQSKFILKDIRLFYNTIDKAIATVRSAGVNIISAKSESEDAIELTIRIPKKGSAPQTDVKSADEVAQERTSQEMAPPAIALPEIASQETASASTVAQETTSQKEQDLSQNKPTIPMNPTTFDDTEAVDSQDGFELGALTLTGTLPAFTMPQQELPAILLHRTEVGFPLSLSLDGTDDRLAVTQTSAEKNRSRPSDGSHPSDDSDAADALIESFLEEISPV